MPGLLVPAGVLPRLAAGIVGNQLGWPRWIITTPCHRDVGSDDGGDGLLNRAACRRQVAPQRMVINDGAGGGDMPDRAGSQRG